MTRRKLGAAIVVLLEVLVGGDGRCLVFVDEVLVLVAGVVLVFVWHGYASSSEVCESGSMRG
jgi:hypothetical protein